MLFQTVFDPAYARKSFLPISNETLALGSSTVRWANIYSKVFNVSDGTRTGVLQATSNGIEVGSSSANDLRFLVGGTMVARFRTGFSDPFLSFNGNPTLATVDNARVITIGAGASPTYSAGAYIQFIGNVFGSSDGHLKLNTGNATGARVDLAVWSTDGAFRVYVNGASDLAFQILYDKNVEHYGVIDYKGTMANSSKNPTSDAPADWVQVKIAGTTYYLPAYAA